MDKAIVTVLLIICGIVATLAMFNGVMPAIQTSQSTINQAAAAASDRIGSRIEIIQAGADGSHINLWVKNIGTVDIPQIQQSNVFLVSGGIQVMVSYGGAIAPFWGYQFTGSDAAWTQSATIEVTITIAAPLEPGSYSIEFITPNGISDQRSFGV